ncbi:MAG: hypothetical protein RQ745_14125, partial [Longimicrobiales bacterium]|nr:hypothetical protein [Longimicrobiales bacterium]
EGIEVTVERRSDYLDRTGFYDRRKRGFGDFIDVEAMDVSRILTPGQLLTRLPGTTLDGLGDPYFPRTRTFGPICYPMIVVDGITVRNDPQPFEDSGYSRTDEFRNLVPRANEISAIEVYRSSAQAPVEWKSSANNCGMIMIWTKR